MWHNTQRIIIPIALPPIASKQTPFEKTIFLMACMDKKCTFAGILNISNNKKEKINKKKYT